MPAPVRGEEGIVRRTDRILCWPQRVPTWRVARSTVRMHWDGGSAT